MNINSLGLEELPPNEMVKTDGGIILEIAIAAGTVILFGVAGYYVGKEVNSPKTNEIG